MDHWRTRRVDISKFTFVFFALAVSIFGWGLQYKLSLYSPHTISHNMPEAKLLSREEDGIPGQPGSIEQQALAPALMGLLVACALFLFATVHAFQSRPALRGLTRDLCRPWLRRSGSFSSAFFLRPPPVRL